MREKFFLNKRLLLLTLIILNFLLIKPSLAEMPDEQKVEIDHLLNFVKNSSCTFNRNGSKYPSEESVKHIQKKYDYFKDDIETSEDFIKYSATKSTMSGKYYTVKCPSQTAIKSKDWLLNELNSYRIKN